MTFLSNFLFVFFNLSVYSFPVPDFWNKKKEYNRSTSIHAQKPMEFEEKTIKNVTPLNYYLFSVTTNIYVKIIRGMPYVFRGVRLQSPHCPAGSWIRSRFLILLWSFSVRVQNIIHASLYPVPYSMDVLHYLIRNQVCISTKPALARKKIDNVKSGRVLLIRDAYIIYFCANSDLSTLLSWLLYSALTKSYAEWV